MNERDIVVEDEDFYTTHPLALPAVPSTPENRPTFHDMRGLTAAEYRARQARLALGSGDPEVSLEERVRSHYHECKNRHATARQFNLTVYYVGKILKSRPV